MSLNATLTPNSWEVDPLQSPNVSAPFVFEGKLVVGQTLSIVESDAWTITAIQWKRDGVDISGETNSTYVITNADVGTVISAVATIDTYERSTGKAVIAGAGGGVTFQRSASATNIGFANFDTVSAAGDATLGRADSYFRFPVFLTKELANNFFATYSNSSLRSNATNNLGCECAIEDGATVIPITWGGASTVDAAVGDEPKSDIVLPTAFESSPYNRVVWIRGRFFVPNVAGARMPRQGTAPSSHVAGTQCYNCDSRAAPGSIYATGPFAVTTGMYANARTLAPMVIGNFSSNVRSYIGLADSLFAGNNNTTGDSKGGWLQKSFRDSSELNPNGLMIFGEAGMAADQVILANFSWAVKYANIGVEGYGTNSGINAGNANFVLGKSKDIATEMRAKGLTRVVRVQLIPKTTGTFTSDAGQTPFDAGWVVGGVIDTWNRTSLTANTAPNSGYVWDVLIPFTSVRSASDYWKWISPGGVSATIEGTHPNLLGEDLMSDEARPILDAVTY